MKNTYQEFSDAELIKEMRKFPMNDQLSLARIQETLARILERLPKK